ncbi:hypothetical protein PQQ51_11740 [Paraburkholderia xenovorans]|uniref:hypothetical protein n=1 Tax=Paraburkholderia xenovorans TaxID=36873 RepID=UPI0038BDD4ED
MPQVGYQWLSNTYGVVPVHPFAVRSEIGRVRSTSTDGDIRREIYPEAYRPAANLPGHLGFAFRCEGIHLEFLARLYALPAVRSELEAWIAREPTGAYARRACFFYEWLMPQVLERFSRPLMQHYADQYTFGKTKIAADGVEYNLHFQGYDDALPAWRYPDLTAHVVYLADVIDATLTHEMRVEARFLHANDKARRAIKEFLEAPDTDLDRIIRSIRQNGNSVSNSLRKRYPIFDERPELSTQIIEAVTDAFSDENHE